MGVVAGSVIFLPAALVLYLMHSRSDYAIREEIRGNLTRLAKAASVLVDTDLHKTFKSPDQESTEEYARAIAPLERFIESDINIVYVYTCVLVDGKVHFVLDPTPAGDSDGDGVDDKSHVMEEYMDPTPEMLESLRTQRASAESEPSSDAWGTFISGYAPIFDEDGEFIGIVGVDLSADRFVERLKNVKQATMFGFVAALFISAVFGVGAGFVQRRRDEHRLEQGLKNNELADLAESLETANGQLRYASRRFEQLFGAIPVACFTLDQAGTIYEWNSVSEHFFGRNAHEVIQTSIYDTIADAKSHKMFAALLDAVFSGKPVQDVEWTEARSSGEVFTAIVSAFPLFGGEGNVTGAIVACADVTERKMLQTEIERQMREVQHAYGKLDASKNDLAKTNSALSSANKQLIKLATVDGLTNVLNRRTVFDNLERAMSSARRTGRPLSILMLDIDHFKALNDAHGHIMGDAVLKGVAAQLLAACRLEDEVGRFGGEEFLVLLPETNADEAMTVAERIRKRVALMDTDGVSCTISIGVSTYNENLETSERFIDLADRALYEAKRSGRNRALHSRDLAEGAA